MSKMYKQHIISMTNDISEIYSYVALIKGFRFFPTIKCIRKLKFCVSDLVKQYPGHLKRKLNMGQ